MLESILLFGLLTWGLCFLFADAKIFGCSTKEYKYELDEYGKIGAKAVLEKDGIVPLRNFLLKRKFFKEFFGCYFCLGFWCGSISHLFLLFTSSKHFIEVDGTAHTMVFGLLVAAIMGAVLSYLIDLFVEFLEALQDN